MRYFILFFLIFGLSNFNFASKNLVIKGSLKILSVGDGMSGGMTSQPSDFKNLVLVVNEKDSLFTTMSTENTFEFPAIDSHSEFRILFLYRSENNYLNRSVLFEPNGKKFMLLNYHRNDSDAPHLSEYAVSRENGKLVLELKYGIYFFLHAPYQPAGLDVYPKLPLQQANFQKLHFPMLLSLQTEDAVRGTVTVYPQFNFKLVSDSIQLRYTGFNWGRLKLNAAKSVCFDGIPTEQKLPCNLQKLTRELHQQLAQIDASYETVVLGKNTFGVYFEQPTLIKIDPKTPLKTENELTDVEPPTILTFNVQNLTRKTIYFKIDGVSEQWDAGVNTSEVKIKKNETKTITVVRFSMNNPKNYKAKTWLPEFPNEFLSDYHVYVGKKRIKTPTHRKWVIEKGELSCVYTLVLGL